MIATTMKGRCLVGVLVVIGCLTESRAFVSFDQVNPDNSSVSDDDLLKSTTPEQQTGVSTEKPKVIRVPLEPRRSRHAIEDDGHFRDTNANLKRHDSTHVSQTTESIVDSLQKSVHKMHKKKSRMSKKFKVSKKTRRSVDNAARQQLTEIPNRSEEYYAQRKAIIDRFHARHREIARKYEQTTTTTTTTEGPFRYNLGFERLSTATENHRFQFAAATQPPKVVRRPPTLQVANPSERLAFHGHEDKRRAFSDDHDGPRHATTTLAPTTTPDPHQPKDKDFWEVGECDALENLTMFYQKHLLLGISEKLEVEMWTSPGQDTCIVCTTVQRYSGEVKSTPNIKSNTLFVKVASGKDVVVSLIAKFYTDYKKDGHC